MQKWKPLIASLVVIALALGVMALWKCSGDTPTSNGGSIDNSPADDDGTSTGDDGFTWVTTKLDDLPALDPLGLWPRDGQRIASPEFNVMWETSDHSDCRLLVSTDRLDWYVMGHTSGKRHFLPVNFGDFESKLYFAVEFDFQDKRYRSKAREVTFGNGARFNQLEHRFTIRGIDTQTFDVAMTGRDPADMPPNAFVTGWFPLELGVGTLPGESGTLLFVLSTPEIVRGSTFGWLEVYDAAANTYDRVLIHLGH